MAIRVVAVSALLVTTLAGCGVIEDRSQRYVDATARAPIKTANEAQRARIGEAYPIRELPGRNQGRLYASEIPVPPDMTAEILEQNYLVEALDDNAWLLVNEVPGQLWPRMTAYLNDRGLGVAYDSPQLGQVQSELVNYSRRARELLELPLDADNEPLMLVQARVAPGVRRKTTELQLRPRRVASAPAQLLQWQARAIDIELEKKLLADLAEFLQARDDTKSYSRAALGIANVPRVQLITEGERPVALAMTLGFDRAWIEVRKALAQAGVTVVDLDRSEGQLYVDFRSEKELSRGWFRWFADDPEPEYTFHVSLARDDGGVRVTTGKAGDHQGEDRSAQLLSRLYEQLY
ncbi:outer membrane protein assembly factor BamC [Marinobacter sp. X15-166B]|uniref:outer membrane protein assembly factor BamC n=1 Tax=Marinobacter sp. X15-166B TaxID=1897620 RepID=UPI00085CADD3|nr:outer membrane protein assembly factor BamC [Marinobacter sp. X15-166B]OEY67258.1 hypothetical protein BG841_12915 [Marinobacter sp. X15-166B]